MDMTDFVRETCEKDFENVVEEMDVDGEVEDELEIGPETGVGLSDDEEEFSDGDNDNYDSDQEICDLDGKFTSTTAAM